MSHSGQYRAIHHHLRDAVRLTNFSLTRASYRKMARTKSCSKLSSRQTNRHREGAVDIENSLFKRGAVGHPLTL